ncbi:transposase [Aquincola tertiaricarbonis]|uniref:transposase n=1 Tax=Aquincola tertiaricarbonis TaxID=391953 RepID=UPI0012EE7553
MASASVGSSRYACQVKWGRTSIDLEALRQRLVLRHKPGGRCLYDKTAKAEFVEQCLQPVVSVARLAREFGINANQVACWIRDLSRAVASTCSGPRPPF